ncbi:PAS domain S-box protein [Alkalinema sp. FACHB-956]|uniref:PAS domain S-box protein n=1 Tax=Alkalinema sp. FACHB-956 TaxID=2692768 RepID=UPI001684580F|nr:PAS domain S-box protein [Alkalinema sp. FACHB-956]MBD2325435.1 PAS domain S-box protein [Alkalinema sp. FACHB-956]
MDPIVEVAGYDLGELLYESARTWVYRAVRTTDRRSVIIKLLRTPYPTVLELIQFRNQFHCARSIQSPHVVQPYALEPWQNGFALIMEDFGGVSLPTYLDRRQRVHTALESSPETIARLPRSASPRSATVPLTEFFPIAQQIVDILQLLGQHNLVHKDIKPSNFLIHPKTQFIKITDFSVASWLPSDSPMLMPPQRLEGTLAYLSPEQTGRMNRGMDYRSDFYAVGITWFELLTGQLPFQAEDALEWVHCHIAQQPPLAHECNSIVPPMLSAIINKLLAKDPDDRYQSVLGLRHDLEVCQEAWYTQSAIPPFPLASQDRCDRFRIPDKLYGRDAEVAELLDAFDRIAGANPLAETSTTNSQSTPSQSTPSQPAPSPCDRSELILVTGVSGVGKTAVVNEVYRSIVVQRRGYCIQGKFDQSQRDNPFSAFVQALQNLVQQVLCESEQQLRHWRSQLLAALGKDSQVILEIIPELEQILGPQPPAVELSGSAVQNRFYRLFQKFIQVFANQDHPLVIFLDDLQWADRASLRMMHYLLESQLESQASLLLIGAYREDEVPSTHPLRLTLEAIEQAGVRVRTLFLPALTLSALRCLISDTFSCYPGSLAALTQLVYQQTQGNPFFTKQLLFALYKDGFIIFNPVRGEWQWDLAQISEWMLTDDIVQLMIGQIHKLPQQTQDSLKLAACLGNQFTLDTLSLILNQSDHETADRLWPALQAGLITATSDIYQLHHVKADDRLILLSQTCDIETDLPVRSTYQFIHDRIQQAAYELIPESDQSSVHNYIGQLLLQKLSLVEQAERLFEIVQHLNAGSVNVSSVNASSVAMTALDLASPELLEITPLMLSQLNWQAGEKAKNTTAYAAAIEYFTHGIHHLPTNAWQQHYDLALALHRDRVEVAYLNTDYAQIEPWSAVVLSHARDVLDTIPVQITRIITARAQRQFQTALQIGRQVLQGLGIALPESPQPSDIATAAQQTWHHWRDRAQQLLSNPTVANAPVVTTEPSPLNLVSLPAMTDRTCLAAMQILTNLVSAAYMAEPELFPFLVFKQVELSIGHGHCPVSAMAYTDYAAFLCGSNSDIEIAYEFSQLALHLLEQLPANLFKSRAYFVISGFIHHWKDDLHTILPRFLEGYHSGWETGDWECVALNASSYCQHAYFSGQELPQLAEEMQLYEQIMTQMKQAAPLTFHRIYWQTVLNLLEQSGQASSGLESNSGLDVQVLQSEDHGQCLPYHLQGSVFDAAQMIPNLQAANDRTGLAHTHFNQTVLCYLFGQYEAAAQYAALTEQHLDALVAQIQVVLYHFYDALIHLANYRSSIQKLSALESTSNAPQQLTLQELALQELALTLERVALHQEKLQAWSHCAPNNHQHRWELVEAERQAVLGNHLAAMDFYDRAIASAKQNRFIQDEALANERAAEFYLAWGKPKIAQVYLTDAYYAYARWGATAKINHLEQHYAHLLIPLRRNLGNASHDSVSNLQTTLLLGQALDFSSIIKASQILAGEVVLDQLLTKLMQVVLENAGATRGVMILQEERDWTIAAMVDHPLTQVIRPPKVPLESRSDLPLPLIHYVINCQEPIVLDEVRITSWFATDPYWQTHPVCSVLAMPILGQGKLMGILYLENEVTPAAFSHGRVDWLKILCTQAAIALENAQLYQQLEAYSQSLEQRVQERTDALHQSERRYATLTEHSPVGIFRADAQGNSLYHNPKWLEMAGQSSADSTGANWEEAIHPLDRERVIREWCTAVQNQQGFFSEYRLQKPDGTVTWVVGQAVSEQDDQGQVLGYVGTVTDISRRKASEQRYAALTEAVPVGLFRLDHRGRCVYINNRWCELTQQAPESALGQGWLQTIHPDDRPWVLTAWRQAYTEQGGYYQGEGRCLLPDGRVSWFYCQITPEIDTVGHPIGYLGAITDITALKETEANLKRAETEANIREQQVISLLNNIPHIAWLKDLESRFLAVNQPFAQACGYTPEELVGMRDQDIWPADLAAGYVQDDREVMQSRQQKRVEERLITVDGTEQWIETIKTPIVADGNAVIGTAGIAMNITDRKKAEQALANLNQELEQRVQRRTEEFQQQTHLLQTILNSMGDGVVVANAAGEIILHNPAVEQITGLQGLHSQTEEWQSLWGIYLPDGSPCSIDQIPLAQAIQGHAVDQAELLLQNAVRSEGLHVEVTARPLTDAAGTVIGGVAVFRDVTVRKQMEEVLRQTNLDLERRVEERTAELRQAMESAEAANRTKSTFLANMSHELRTPLNAILGFSQLLAQDPHLNSNHQEQLSIINRSGEHLLGLINDILEMSKIEAGRSVFHPNPFDLPAFLESLIQMFQLKANHKGLRLTWEHPEPIPQYIQTDENKLRQVLINLLSNAIKFTDRGQIRLRVKSCEFSTQDGSIALTTFHWIDPQQAAYLICEVEDTGMGIAPEELNLLFEPFVQSSTQPRLQEGTGLGLPISREFVRLMGGDLTVESRVGQGSCFRFHLPIEAVATDRIPAPVFTQRPIGLAPEQPTYRILVVEDHAANRKLMLSLLQPLGFQVREAINGQEAVELWELWQPHLIWMDIRMPVMDGYEATQQIRQRERLLPDRPPSDIASRRALPAVTPSLPTKIIALTAGAFEEERMKTLAMGCDDFVPKPLQDRLILDKLVEHLGVRYLFAESPPHPPAAPEVTAAPSVEDALVGLRAMPIDWVMQLRQATIEVHVERLLELIQEIPAPLSDLHRLIANKIQSFDFEHILNLIAQEYPHIIP